MIKRPTGPFWDASHHTSERKKQLDKLALNPPRDKDNADHRPTPPKLTPGGETNRAARGASGTKRKMPTPSHQKAADNKPVRDQGDLKKTFKTIARALPTKAHDLDR